MKRNTFTIIAVAAALACAAIITAMILARPTATAENENIETDPKETVEETAQDSRKEMLEELREKYPECFGLERSGMFYVYVWQTSEEKYVCALSKEKTDTPTVITNGPDIDEMKTILSSYYVPQTRIYVIPVRDPQSSFYYEIDDAYRMKLQAKFRIGSNS